MIFNAVTKKVAYLDGNTTIGIFRCCGNKVVIVDTGIDNDVAKQILRALSFEKLSVSAILLTHSHADHCGGSAYIRQHTGARVFAPVLEAAIIENPELEPVYLYSGANPLQELHNKFLEATACSVDYKIASDSDSITIDDVNIEVIALAGHSMNQLGYAYDGVLFCGDAVFGNSLLKRHRIPYFTNISKARESILRLMERRDMLVVPSHGNPASSISALGDDNLASIDNMERVVLAAISRQMGTNEIAKAINAELHEEVKCIQQFFLTNTVILAFLSYLHDKGLVNPFILGNNLVWEKSDTSMCGFNS